MAKGFVKLIRSKETEQLLIDDPDGFLLLTVIALRANRDKETNSIGLEQGEATVGDYRNYGLTRQRYRSALLRLRGKKWGFQQDNQQNNQQVTIKTTNKGTVAKLVSNSIYDINIIDDNQQNNPQPTIKVTTNKKRLKNKEVKERAHFVKPSVSEVEVYAKSINFTLNGNTFVDYYQRQGWKLSNGRPMQDWQAAIRNWKNRRTEKQNNGTGRKHRQDTQYEVPAEYAAEALEV